MPWRRAIAVGGSGGGRTCAAEDAGGGGGFPVAAELLAEVEAASLARKPRTADLDAETGQERARVTRKPAEAAPAEDSKTGRTSAPPKPAAEKKDAPKAGGGDLHVPLSPFG